MKFSKKLTTLATIVAAGFATNAAAETATDTIDVYAGLAPVLEMECTDVNFGVWRVPTGDRSGTTTVTLDAGSTATATVTSGGAADTAVSLSTKYNAPAAGTCNVTGSTVTSGNGAASITTGSSGTFLGTASNPFATGLAAPTALPPGSAFDFTLSLSTATPAINANGEATFQVIGSMEIPNNLVSDNYGAYKSEGSSTVQFDDTPL
ncbi:MAG TPA: hypothetical protein VIC08_06040 [Cellvibrionaceae bacterium]